MGARRGYGAVWGRGQGFGVIVGGTVGAGGGEGAERSACSHRPPALCQPRAGPGDGRCPLPKEGAHLGSASLAPTSVPSCACTAGCRGVPGAPGAVCALLGDRDRGSGAGCAGVPGRACGEGGSVPAPRGGQDKGLVLRLGGCAVASRFFSAPYLSRRSTPPVPGGRWSWGAPGCEGGDTGGPIPVGLIPFPSPALKQPSTGSRPEPQRRLWLRPEMRMRMRMRGSGGA